MYGFFCMFRVIYESCLYLKFCCVHCLLQSCYIISHASWWCCCSCFVNILGYTRIKEIMKRNHNHQLIHKHICKKGRKKQRQFFVKIVDGVCMGVICNREAFEDDEESGFVLNFHRHSKFAGILTYSGIFEG